MLPRPKHDISRKRISRNTLQVLYRLHEAGHDVFIVGGGVRDLLLGRSPKDFDIATSAHPEEIKALFRNSRIIGRRFRLVHVFYGREIIEIATFRGKGEDSEQCKTSGMILRDNVYGTQEDDAWRRDFTVNALYYNIADFSVIDYCGGLHDLSERKIRLIGDVRKRFHEDPVRMLRAVRLAVKLGFEIEKDTREPIPELAGLIQNVPPARLFHELNKLLMEGYASQVFPELRKFGLFAVMFPYTEKYLEDENSIYYKLIEIALKQTDLRLEQGRSLNPAFLLAVLLWPIVQDNLVHFQAEGMHLYPALSAAIRKVLDDQRVHVSMPQRHAIMMREIWNLQYRLQSSCNPKAKKLITNPRYRAAYDFLELRYQAGEPLESVYIWWTEFAAGSKDQREAMVKASLKDGARKGRKRRKKKPRKPKDNPEVSSDE